MVSDKAMTADETVRRVLMPHIEQTALRLSAEKKRAAYLESVKRRDEYLHTRIMDDGTRDDEVLDEESHDDEADSLGHFGAVIIGDKRPGDADPADQIVLRQKTADEMLAAMSPSIRALVRQDAGFRLASVLTNVQRQKQEKLFACAKLQSVLSALSAQKAIIEAKSPEWGSW